MDLDGLDKAKDDMMKNGGGKESPYQPPKQDEAESFKDNIPKAKEFANGDNLKEGWDREGLLKENSKEESSNEGVDTPKDAGNVRVPVYAGFSHVCMFVEYCSSPCLFEILTLGTPAQGGWSWSGS